MAVDVEPADLAPGRVDERRAARALPGSLRAEGEARRRRRRAWSPGRSSTSRSPERRCRSAGSRPRRSTRPRTRPARPASTLSRLLPGAMSAAMAAWPPVVPRSAPCPAARRARWLMQSAPSAASGVTGAQVQIRPHARSIPPSVEPPAGAGHAARRRRPPLRRHRAPTLAPRGPRGQSEATRRIRTEFVTVARLTESSWASSHSSAGSAGLRVPAIIIATRVPGMSANGTSGVGGRALLADGQQRVDVAQQRRARRRRGTSGRRGAPGRSARTGQAAEGDLQPRPHSR